MVQRRVVQGQRDTKETRRLNMERDAVEGQGKAKWRRMDGEGNREENHGGERRGLAGEALHGIGGV